MAKMNANLTLTKDYRKKDCLAAQKTNPKQTQSKPVVSAVEWANLRKAEMSLKSLAGKSGNTRIPIDKKNTLPCGTKLYILCAKILGN